jgi:DNA repair photolyase
MKRKKTMKKLAVAVLLVGVSLAPILSVSADESRDNEELQRARMTAVVEQYIQSREAKSEMLDSRCEAVRESAKLSCEKAEFCKMNRERLVNELLAGEYEPTAEQVYPYLQKQFFDTDRARAYVHNR